MTTTPSASNHTNPHAPQVHGGGGVQTMTMPGGEGEERCWSIYIYISLHINNLYIYIYDIYMIYIYVISIYRSPLMTRIYLASSHGVQGDPLPLSLRGLHVHRGQRRGAPGLQALAAHVGTHLLRNIRGRDIHVRCIIPLLSVYTYISSINHTCMYTY